MAFHKSAAQDHAIRELQGKATTVVAGAGADTDIAVAGITVADTLGSVLMNAAGTLSDVSADASITSDGNIQLTSSSAGNQLVVEWYAHVGS